MDERQRNQCEVCGVQDDPYIIDHLPPEVCLSCLEIVNEVKANMTKMVRTPADLLALARGIWEERRKRGG